jgi:excisionase family DNA binding protein
VKSEEHTMDEELKASELITLKEAAEYSGFNPVYLAQLANRGRLKATKYGNVWLTTKEAVDEYIRSRKKRGAYRNDIGT